MARTHISFWMDFLGKVGPPIFAATLLGCLLSERLELIHGLLLLISLLLIGISQWHAYHK
jgi:hypothetical protein